MQNLSARYFTGVAQQAETRVRNLTALCRKQGAKIREASAQLDARPHFVKSNRCRASVSQNVSGLPYSDDQKKTRMRSHLSA
jgi:hypothetical protein